MRLRPWVIDLLVALAIAAIVLIVSPGVAIDGILALLVLLVCGITLLWDWRRGRNRRRSGRAAPRRDRPTVRR
jgi:predicted membrane metal-binding protein